MVRFIGLHIRGQAGLWLSNVTIGIGGMAVNHQLELAAIATEVLGLRATPRAASEGDESLSPVVAEGPGLPVAAYVGRGPGYSHVETWNDLEAATGKCGTDVTPRLHGGRRANLL